MNFDIQIKQSEWWRLAQQMPDRHYDPSERVFLSDHLQRVQNNLHFLDPAGMGHEYFSQLRAALATAGMDILRTRALLEPVALLHDLGKTKEDKEAEGPHPITGKSVRMRHPVVGVIAALDLLPVDCDDRDTILALIEEHDTPYSWYVQYKRSGQVPKEKSWARLDRAIDAREDGTGILLLCIFKLADIDGHEDVEDVVWFFELAYGSYLRQKGKWVPIPDSQAVRSLECGAS